MRAKPYRLITVSDIYHWVSFMPGGVKVNVIEEQADYSITLEFHRQHRRNFNLSDIRNATAAGIGVKLKQVGHSKLRSE